jgi:hypothetical protein
MWTTETGDRLTQPEFRIYERPAIAVIATWSPNRLIRTAQVSHNPPFVRPVQTGLTGGSPQPHEAIHNPSQYQCLIKGRRREFRDALGAVLSAVGRPVVIAFYVAIDFLCDIGRGRH